MLNLKEHELFKDTTAYLNNRTTKIQQITLTFKGEEYRNRTQLQIIDVLLNAKCSTEVIQSVIITMNTKDKSIKLIKMSNSDVKISSSENCFNCHDEVFCDLVFPDKTVDELHITIKY